MDTVFAYICEHWPIGAAILITGIVIWKVAEFYFNRFKPVEKTSKRLEEHSNCRAHANDLDMIKGAIKNIERILIKIDATNVDSFSMVNSPRQLNEVGRRFYEQSGSQKLLMDNIELFITSLEDIAPPTALDVEREAYSMLLKMSDNEIFNNVKNYIYNNPKIGELDVSVNTSCYVMSLELRNEYLKKHQEVEQNL